MQAAGYCFDNEWVDPGVALNVYPASYVQNDGYSTGSLSNSHDGRVLSVGSGQWGFITFMPVRQEVCFDAGSDWLSFGVTNSVAQSD